MESCGRARRMRRKSRGRKAAGVRENRPTSAVCWAKAAATRARLQLKVLLGDQRKRFWRVIAG